MFTQGPMRSSIQAEERFCGRAKDVVAQRRVVMPKGVSRQSVSSTKALRCLDRCVNLMPKSLKAPFQECVTQVPKDSVPLSAGKPNVERLRAGCLESIEYANLLERLATCQESVTADSPVLERLAKRFKRKGMRPFFVVQATEAENGDAAMGFKV